MITLEFGIKNTKKKKKKAFWFSTLAKNIALHCKFYVMFLYECSVDLSSIVCEWPHRYIHLLDTSFCSPSV